MNCAGALAKRTQLFPHGPQYMQEVSFGLLTCLSFQL